MNTQKAHMLRPDSKGRITLGIMAQGVSRFAMTIDEHKRIILEPFVEIPAQEQWLFANKSALKQVRQGLKDSAEGKVTKRGSFKQYSDDKIE